MLRVLCRNIAALVATASACLTVQAQNITVTDMAQRQVSLPAKVDRIVALGPGALRLMTYLQSTERIVGVEDIDKGNPAGRPYILAHPELARLPRASKGGPSEINKKPDLEALLSVNPQVVFTTYMSAAVANDLQQTLNVPVVVLSYGGSLGTFNQELHTSLGLAGKILQREQRAKAVSSFILQTQQDLQKRIAAIPASQRPSAYVGGIGQRGAQGIESSEQNYAPFDWLGVNNLAKQLNAERGTHVKADKEALLKLNPPFIFIDGSGKPLVQADYAKNPQFYQALQAFQKDRVYHLLPFNMYTTNIDTVMADAYAVGKVLYPQQFADINLPRKADEIYTFMVGKPVYSLMQSSHGALGEKIVFKP